MKEIEFSTDREMQLIQLTDRVEEKLSEAELEDGFVHIFAPHATGAIIINESADPKVQEDIIDKLKDLFPKDAGYKHDVVDNNAHSHLMSTFLGCSETVPVAEGELQLGTWQDISFVETDGPRSKRKIYLQFVEKGF